MNLQHKALLTVLWMAVGVMPTFAQLERVVVRAVEGDIDCLACAVTIEIALKNLPSVDKVGVSMSKQMIAITFKEGASFQPKEYREAIAKAEVRVREFHAAMRGKVEEQDGKQYFVVGKDRFLITKSSKPVPLGVVVGVMALVDDSSLPYKITVDDFKPQ
jgi:copper chaperone CopZ